MIFDKYNYKPKYKIGFNNKRFTIIGFKEGNCKTKPCYKVLDKKLNKVLVYCCDLFDRSF